MKTPGMLPKKSPSPSTLAPAGLVMPAAGREGIGHNMNPMHAALHAANSARLSAMDKAKDSMSAGGPAGAIAPKLAVPVIPTAVKPC